jgi:hypothetical protein
VCLFSWEPCWHWSQKFLLKVVRLSQVRWQYTMRPALPPPRQDVTAMLGALLVMLVSFLTAPCVCCTSVTTTAKRLQHRQTSPTGMTSA